MSMKLKRLFKYNKLKGTNFKRELTCTCIYVKLLKKILFISRMGYGLYNGHNLNTKNDNIYDQEHN